MYPDMTHNHVWLGDAPLVEGLGVGPHMVRDVGGRAGEVVGVEEGAWVDNNERKGYRYEKGRENMSGSISSVACECATQGVCR